MDGSSSSSSITIKSTYAANGGTLRRLTLKTTPPPTFADLESKLANLHRIPGPFTVTYKDHDGDAVTIDSTRELLEVLKTLASSGLSTLRVEVFDRTPLEDDFELLHNDSSSRDPSLHSDSEDESHASDAVEIPVVTAPIEVPPVKTDAESKVEEEKEEEEDEGDEQVEEPHDIQITPTIAPAVGATIQEDEQEETELSFEESPEKVVLEVEDEEEQEPSNPFVDPPETAQVEIAKPVEAKSSKSWAAIASQCLPLTESIANVPVGITEICNLETSQQWVYSTAEERWIRQTANVEEAEEQTQPVVEPAATTCQPKPEEELDEVKAFIGKITPFIEGLARCIEEKPHLLSELTKVLPQTLAGHNFGLVLENEDSTPFRPPSGPSHRHRHHRHHHRHHRVNDPNVSSSEGPHTWYGVYCDGCQGPSFTGKRFKCDEVTCPDYDLCETCFRDVSRYHEPSHHFVELIKPTQVHRHVTCDGCERKSFAGSRYKCVDCPDFDLCNKCIVSVKEIHQANHWFNRIDNTPARRIRGAPLMGQVPAEVIQAFNLQPPLVPTPAPVPVSAPAAVPTSSDKGKAVSFAEGSSKDSDGWKEVSRRKSSPTLTASTPSSSSFSSSSSMSTTTAPPTVSSFRVENKPSAYHVFMKTELPRIKQANPALSHKDAFKIAVMGWKHHPTNPMNVAAVPVVAVPPYTELRPTGIDEVDGSAMSALVDMGFMDIEVNKRLLKRYPGNVDKVTEILLRRSGGLDEEDDSENEYIERFWK
ncbi:hypothetical protein HDU97_010131 [Phlyctochytrium planicorne]|nr:hypothetical protein HDU97_010131 [Phlyctochytrium planicorne]